MRLRQFKYNRVTVFFSWLRFLLLKGFYKKIIIGASGRGLRGYLKTEGKYFDVLRKDHWEQVSNLSSIVAEGVWEHLIDPQLATTYAYCQLDYGGELVIAVPGHTEDISRMAEFGHLWHFEEEQLIDMFRLAGFKKVEILVSDSRIKYSCRECLIIRGIR